MKISRSLHMALIITGMFVAFGISGCASGLGSSDYSRADARRVQEVQMGVVEHVREVRIEGTKTGIGAAAGTVAGGISGGGVGHGRGSAVAGIAGAVIGGVVGAAAEEGFTRQKGMEITVTLDQGRTIVVVQAAEEQFKVGDRVRVLTGSGGTRVTH
jgi:outer membrane lipoprotein SlyB